jgi:hypothetical protein
MSIPLVETHQAIAHRAPIGRRTNLHFGPGAAGRQGSLVAAWGRDMTIRGRDPATPRRRIQPRWFTVAAETWPRLPAARP